MRDLQGVIDCGKGEIPVGVGVRCRLKAGLLDRRRPRGKHPTLHHRAPDRDIADGIRFDGQRICDRMVIFARFPGSNVPISSSSLSE